MWEQIGCLCTAALLAYHSVFDIKRRCIPGRSLALGVAVSCGWAIGKGLLGVQSWAMLGAGLLPGIAASWRWLGPPENRWVGGTAGN